jgi:hypothetical protein
LDWSFWVGFLGGALATVSKELVTWIYREFTRRMAELDGVESILFLAITESRSLAIAHWSAREDSTDAASRKYSIVARIQFCAKLYPELLAGSVNEKREVDVRFVAFRKALTGDEFGQLNRSPSPERANEIEVSTYELVSQIKMGRIRSKRILSWLW